MAVWPELGNDARLIIDQRTAVLGHLRDKRIIDGIHNNRRILGRARRCIVKGFGGSDFFGSFGEIGGLIHDDSNISGANRHGRSAGGLRAVDVILAPCANNFIAAFHQTLSFFFGSGCGDHLDEVRVFADFLKLGMNEGNQPRAGLHALGRGGDNDGIAAFERVDDIVRRCGGGVCRWHNRANDAHGTCDFGDACGGIVAYHAVCCGMLNVAHQAQGFTVIFGDLIGNIAKTCCAHGQFGQLLIAGRFHDGPCGGLSGAVIAMLRAVRFIPLLRGTRPREDRVQL